MCGICGAFNFGSDQPVERGLIERMNNEIAHRGPDDAGVFVSGNIGIGMRRLSIVDLAHGHQPISNEDGSVWIVFNGEIYNHSELAEQLKARGHRYSSRSDTETIVHLYEEYGDDCVKWLRGMFAFAIWDTRRGRLFVARDRVGIKPFYYTLNNGEFVFASEIKSLIASGRIRPALNEAAIPEYLAFGYLSGEDTLYAGVRKLLPGHSLSIDMAGKIDLKQYWDLPVAEEQESKSFDCYVRTYREMLEDAVASHLMADVPLGIFLSGGLDSSAVAAIAAKHRKEPVDTFSVGYAEEEYSELSTAKTVSEHIRSRHHEVRVSQDSFFGALPKLIWYEDEPIVWPSSVSLYFVSKLASQRVKVVLTGEGSDETLAGYTRYAWTLKNARWDRLYRGMVPRFVRAKLRAVIANSSLLAAPARRKLQHTFLGRDGENWASFYFDNFYSGFSDDLQGALLSESVRGSSPYANVLEIWESSKGDVLHRLLYTDTKSYLLELLMKQDQMSMAASIESRVPFLDHPLVEFTTTIPARFNIRGLSGKHVLKSAVEDLLPATIIHQKKLGFPTPIHDWLAHEGTRRVEEILLSPRSVERKIFKPDGIRRLIREHKENLVDHTDRLWRLLNFELWMRVCIEGERDFAQDAFDSLKMAGR